MPAPEHDPSIENEPHLDSRFLPIDQSEAKAEAKLAKQTRRASQHDEVDNTVWDEPTLHTDLAGEAAEDQVTYARWLARNMAATGWTKSWLLTFGVALVAGPFAIFGALFSSPEQGLVSAATLLVVVVIGPITEETMKVAAALWVVEKRPYWFKSIAQILLCAIAAGIMFGVIENLLYLYVQFPNAGPSLARWRWSVCVGLHMNCSFVAGIGVARIWNNAIREQHRPILGLGMPWFFIAIAGHGLYNLGVTIAEVAGWLKFE
ncbi:MAG: PrsW family glutamic-type intramembrane protease [Aeoliella sp.]